MNNVMQGRYIVQNHSQIFKNARNFNIWRSDFLCFLQENDKFRKNGFVHLSKCSERLSIKRSLNNVLSDPK